MRTKQKLFYEKFRLTYKNIQKCIQKKDKRLKLEFGLVFNVPNGLNTDFDSTSHDFWDKVVRHIGYCSTEEIHEQGYKLVHRYGEDKVRIENFKD